MSSMVQCPGCTDIFPVHGFERSHTCNECGTEFNPQVHIKLERKLVEDGE